MKSPWLTICFIHLHSSGVSHNFVPVKARKVFQSIHHRPNVDNCLPDIALNVTSLRLFLTTNCHFTNCHSATCLERSLERSLEKGRNMPLETHP